MDPWRLRDPLCFPFLDKSERRRVSSSLSDLNDLEVAEWTMRKAPNYRLIVVRLWRVGMRKLLSSIVSWRGLIRAEKYVLHRGNDHVVASSSKPAIIPMNSAYSSSGVNIMRWLPTLLLHSMRSLESLLQIS